MLTDPLFPLAASAITRPLDVAHRVALTAAAAVIPGPLALAPALIALRRDRDAAATQGTKPPSAPGVPTDVGPPLVAVPGVVGKPMEEAQVILHGVNLIALPRLNESPATEKGVVLMQEPSGDPAKLVPEGTLVKLWVGNGPKAPDADELGDKLDAHLRPLGDGISATNAALARMQVTQEAILTAINALNANITASAKPGTQTGQSKP